MNSVMHLFHLTLTFMLLSFQKMLLRSKLHYTKHLKTAK